LEAMCMSKDPLVIIMSREAERSTTDFPMSFHSPPVGILEFVLSREFLGTEEVSCSTVRDAKSAGVSQWTKFIDHEELIWPNVKNALVGIFESSASEVWLKSDPGAPSPKDQKVVCHLAMAYVLYKLNLLRAPQREFGLAPDVTIDICLQSQSADITKRTLLDPIAEIVEGAPWFLKHTKKRWGRNELVFGSGVRLLVAHGSPDFLLGRNVFSGVVSLEGQQAEGKIMVDALSNQIMSRFGRLPTFFGKLIVDC
jgi:hypothetical protein